MEIKTPWLKNKATGIVSVKAPVGDTQTVTGNPVSISNPSGLTALTGLSVDIEPVQSGEGDPSPTNVRPISGHTSATVTRTVDGSATDYTIDLNGTVYGGTLDVLTGVLTVTHAFVSKYAADIRSASTTGRYFTDIGTSGQFKTDESNMSNWFKFLTNSSITTGQCYMQSGFRVQMQATYATIDDFTAALGSDSIDFCCKLATPTTVQLTPQQVSLLTGTNIISTDMANMTVTTLNPDWQSLIDPSSMKVSRYDLDAGETTGRNLEGYMLRDRQAVKEKIEMEFPPMYASDFHTMMELTKEQSFYVWYYSPYYGQWRAADMYVGDREGNLYYGYDSGHAPEQMWTDIKFNFIER